jgi:hypothetical protein
MPETRRERVSALPRAEGSVPVNRRRVGKGRWDLHAITSANSGSHAMRTWDDIGLTCPRL